MVFPELLRNQLELVLNHTVKHRKTDNFPRMTKQNHKINTCQFC